MKLLVISSKRIDKFLLHVIYEAFKRDRGHSKYYGNIVTLFHLASDCQITCLL